MKRSRTFTLAGALLLAALIGATAVSTGASAVSASGCTPIKHLPPAKAQKQPKPTGKLDPGTTYQITIKTNCGSFTIQLDQKQSPNATASFVALTKRGFFDGTIFHRIVPGFVIQGGDPTGTGTGGPGYSTLDKPPANAKYTHGVVAMAKTSLEPAGTAGSQFFIVTPPSVQLTPDYAIIGKVVKGLDVVDRIGKLGDPNTQQPTQIIEIQKATVSTP